MEKDEDGDSDTGDSDTGDSDTGEYDIHPWYRGFTGTIEKSGKNRYTSWGSITQERNNFVVNELPVGYWTSKFKIFLDGLLENKDIKKVKNYSTPKKVKFVITPHKDGIECNTQTLKLHKYISTSNMVAFDENGQIKKYSNVSDIINSFCKVRITYYIKRKKKTLDTIKNDILFLSNKKRFLMEVMEGTIELFEEKGKSRKTRKLSDLVSELEEKKYDKILKGDVDNEESSKSENGYEYLLRLQFRSITEEQINKLSKEIDSHIKSRDTLLKTSEKQLWINDLNEFKNEYEKW